VKLPVALLMLVVAGALVVALAEAVHLGGQVALRASGRYQDEIHWLESLEPLRVWDPGRHEQIDRRYHDWVERELRAGRLDRAVGVMRRVRARAHARGEAPPRPLVELGLETYTRAADRLERGGRLSLAADWDDTLFVFAVRDADARHRAAATAAFMEGLDLRVRDGKPCEALARVEWARRGLGGEIPGLDPAVGQSLVMRCDESRRTGGAMSQQRRGSGRAR